MDEKLLYEAIWYACCILFIILIFILKILISISNDIKKIKNDVDILYKGSYNIQLFHLLRDVCHW